MEAVMFRNLSSKDLYFHQLSDSTFTSIFHLFNTNLLQSEKNIGNEVLI